MLDKMRGWSLSRKLEHRSMPEPNSGCLLWLAAVNDSGYGIIAHKGRSNLAHRLSWESVKGPIPTGLQALHKCDVPSCINPGHLFLGTNADNVADKVAKGRAVGFGPKGTSHPGHKLTDKAVRAIRAGTASQDAIAAQYGVTQSMVSKIKARRAWAHVGEDNG